MINVISNLVAALCFLTSVSSRARFAKQGLRLIEAEDITVGDYEYVIMLATIKGHEVHRRCTGTIITSKWVLTAAHCVEEYKKRKELELMHIWYLNFTVSPLETKFYSKILEIFIHPHYKYSYNNHKIDMNDIALARVNNVMLPNYGKILATDYKALYGVEVDYVGGGQTTEEPYSNTDEMRPLRSGHGVLIPCDKEYIDIISYPLVCVAPKCTKSKQKPWYSDAGGPLIHDDKIIGILASLSPTVIAAYVPISPYLDWIFSTIDTHSANLYNNTHV